MTRRKKTRSLKRIHQVKTGSISKLKRAAGADRQTGKRVSNKNKSVYEKYLEENPQAREKQPREKQQQPAKTKKPEFSSELYDRKDIAKVKPAREKSEREKEDDLLDRFNTGSLDDFY